MENAQGPQTPPKNYLVESILVTLFCCLPLGIVGIVNAANVNSRAAAGDQIGAEQAAAEAKKWTRLGFILGAVGVALYLLLMALGFGAAILGSAATY